ncbi:thiamine ABC transporter ATP-binding protein [Marinobacter sp. 1Y8]
MLDVREITFRYSGSAPSHNFNCQVAAGECLAVVGPSGCGKSTLLNLIAGFLVPDGGDLLWNNTSFVDAPPWQRPVTSVFQEHNLFDHLPVRDNIGLGIDPGLKLTTDDDNRIRMLLKTVGLEGLWRRYPTELSGGQRQRVAMARALVRKQPVLLLDEPFTGLDHDSRAILWSLLESEKQRGAAIILVSHDPDDVHRLADQVTNLAS